MSTNLWLLLSVVDLKCLSFDGLSVNLSKVVNHGSVSLSMALVVVAVSGLWTQHSLLLKGLIIP